jgi:hypothetical protein
MASAAEEGAQKVAVNFVVYDAMSEQSVSFNLHQAAEFATTRPSVRSRLAPPSFQSLTAPP